MWKILNCSDDFSMIASSCNCCKFTSGNKMCCGVDDPGMDSVVLWKLLSCLTRVG